MAKKAKITPKQGTAAAPRRSAADILDDFNKKLSKMTPKQRDAARKKLDRDATRKYNKGMRELRAYNKSRGFKI